MIIFICCCRCSVLPCYVMLCFLPFLFYFVLLYSGLSCSVLFSSFSFFSSVRLFCVVFTALYHTIPYRIPYLFYFFQLSIWSSIHYSNLYKHSSIASLLHNLPMTFQIYSFAPNNYNLHFKLFFLLTLSLLPLFACLTAICLFICLFVCLSICLCLSVWLFGCMSVCLSESVWLFGCMSVCLFVCLSICPSIYLSVCLSVFQSDKSLSNSILHIIKTSFDTFTIFIQFSCWYLLITRVFWMS